MAKILYLINQGETMGTTEATECFFAITKLFQSKDTILRRMVYLGIKCLSTMSEDVIIVTSSLTKDMTGEVWHDPDKFILATNLDLGIQGDHSK